ncbi:acetyl-CoA carboxylase carboxyltransferase subunit alpha [Actinoplanes sp. CA-051413]|uniref:acetyl-CoA carboxylase carboxyltransferase subunit alpha n=1 Tax=Actinoplanes sp. CA-051413 TaxID=3239899 RepID=UPI003D98723A
MTDAMTRAVPRTAPPPPTADWVRCDGCHGLVYGPRYARDLNVCPLCGRHGPVTAHERLEQLLDPGSRADIPTVRTDPDPLGFTDTRPYPQRLALARAATGLTDAVIAAHGTIEGRPLVIIAMDFRFLGGSLGVAVGATIVRAADEALAARVPFVMVTASGGARMQEGVLALMQMARTAQALAELDEAGLLTVTVVADPTYGGVAASYASLADVVLAEPQARLGFAGPRVIAQTIGAELPPGFQRADFLLAHGLVDRIVPRAGLRSILGHLLVVNDRPGEPVEPQPVPAGDDRPASEQAWEVVRLARHPDRPTTSDYVEDLCTGFVELHGDRTGADCPAILGGIAVFGSRPVVVIGHQKGHTTRELVARDFGMARPSGQRKAARLLRLAAKLGLPVITFIDTPGAHPGVDAEEGGQAGSIAENIRLMARLPVPTVAVITGEGGSGGALALAVADRVLACANAVYSVISPEGCAAILWKEPAATPQAAEALRLRAPDLLALGVIDGIVAEPAGGAHTDPAAAAQLLGAALAQALDEVTGASPAERMNRRRGRIRNSGGGT